MNKSPLYQLQLNFSQYIQNSQNKNFDWSKLGIVKKHSFSVHERMHIYQRAYHQKILQCLEEDFPILKKNLTAEDEFSKLIEDYLIQFPSIYWSIAEVGKNLAKFISQSKWILQYEYLAELALFEWEKNLSNFTFVAKPFDFSLLAHMEEKKQEEIILTLDSSVKLFKSHWSLHEDKIFKSETFYVIYQNKGEVFHTVLSKMQWEIIFKISLGFSISEITSTLTEIQTQEVTNLFSFFVIENIVNYIKI